MGLTPMPVTTAVYVAPGTASSSTAASTPSRTSRTSVSSTSASRVSLDTSVTVTMESPGETGTPIATGAPEADPPEGTDGSCCPPLGSRPSRLSTPPAAPPPDARPRLTTPENGALIVSDFTVLSAAFTAAFAWVREAAWSEAMELDRPLVTPVSTPLIERLSWAVIEASAFVWARCWVWASSIAVRSCLRACRSSIFFASFLALAKWAATLRSNAPVSRDGRRTFAPKLAGAGILDARRAWLSWTSAWGERILARTWPLRTRSPSLTYSLAIVPWAGERSVAEARAPMVAGASTTSVTGARRTSASWTAGGSSDVQPVRANRTSSGASPRRTVTAPS